ncbi:MAG: ATP-binding cassette domain-containing protein, partial [Candidatus Caldarchaeum sp.]
KTTLIRVLSRTLRPVQGRVWLGTKDIYCDYTPRESAQHIAVVPQFEDVVFAFTVREVVRMGRFPWAGTPFAERDFVAEEEALFRARCIELADRRITELSGGERQRVLLARALAQETPILLLDEPTAHMDIGYQLITLSLLRELARQGKAIITALHDLNLASAYADDVCLLHGGRILASGSAEDVFTSEELERVFGSAFVRLRDPLTGRLVLYPEIVPKTTQVSRAVRIHLIGGGGSAAAWITTLFQWGHRLTLGITHLSDSDYETAMRWNVPCVVAPPFQPFQEEHYQEALQLASDAELVIVAPSPYGQGNLLNLRLAQSLRERGIPVWLLPVEKDWDFSGGAATDLRTRLLAYGAEEISREELLRRLIPDGTI